MANKGNDTGKGKAGRPRTVSKEKLLVAIVAERGLITRVGKRVGLTRQAVSKRIEADEDLKEAQQDVKEAMLDTAEDKFWRAVEAGRPWAIKLMLTTVGASRGYTRNLKLSGSLTTTGVVTIIELPSNGRESNGRANPA